MSGDNGQGPKLYSVKEAALFLDCSDRQVRQEIKEGKITYRLPPCGIRFMEEDLLERLRPLGGPGFSRKSRVKKAEKMESCDKRDGLTVCWRVSDQHLCPCGRGASFSTVIRVVFSNAELGVLISEKKAGYPDGTKTLQEEI